MPIYPVRNVKSLKMDSQPTISTKHRPCKVLRLRLTLLLAFCLPLMEHSYCHASTQQPPGGPDTIIPAVRADTPPGALFTSKPSEIIYSGCHDDSSHPDTSFGTPSDCTGATNHMVNIRSAIVLRGFLPSAPPRWRYLAGVSNSLPSASTAPFPYTAERRHVQGGARIRQGNDPDDILRRHEGSDDLIRRVQSTRSFSHETIGGLGNIHQRLHLLLSTAQKKSSSSSSSSRSSSQRRMDVDEYGSGGAATPGHAAGMGAVTTAAGGRGGSSHGQRRRQLKQIYLGPRVLDLNSITLYAGAPSGEVSVSLARDRKFRLTRDGTVNVGAGFSTSQAVAFNPSQGRWWAAVTGEGGQGRPSAATAAWVVVPKFFQCCSWFPSRAYFLGEADTGPSGTTAAGGYYFVTEIGANALSGTLGSSTSQSHAGAVNLPSTTPAASRSIVSRGDEPLGFAGVEALGQTNALVNFADPRVEQYGQAIAYPFNIFTPWDPVTCTQVLVTGLATTGINLLPGTNRDRSGGSAATANRTVALPSERFSAAAAAAGRNGTRTPTGLAPFCLQWFNIQTLDDYRAFVQRTSPAYRTDYMDDGYGYSDYYDMTHGSEDEDNGDNTVPDAPSRRLAPPSLSHTARLAKPDSLRREAPADETPIDRTTASSLPAVAPWPTPAAGTSPTPVAAMAAKRSGSGSGVDGTGTHPLAAAAAQVFPAASSIAPAAAQAPLSQGASSSPTGYLQAQSQPRVQPDMIPPHQGLRTAGSEIEQREEEDDTSGIHPIFVGENRLIDDNNGDAAAVARRQKEGAGLLGLLRARTDDALLPPHLQRLLGRSNPKGGGQRQPLLLLGRPTVAAAASRALTAPEVVAATQRLANTAAQQAVHAAQLVSEGAALRTEAVLRVIVRLVNAGSPFTAFMMNASKAWYDGAARLSNAAVDAAIRRLEEGVPPALADELRRRADDMAVRLSAALQDGLQEGMAPGWGDGSGGR